jgi:hypothetical protein
VPKLAHDGPTYIRISPFSPAPAIKLAKARRNVPTVMLLVTSKKEIKGKEPVSGIDIIPDSNVKPSVCPKHHFGTNYNLDRKTVTEPRNSEIVEKSNNHFIREIS